MRIAVSRKRRGGAAIVAMRLSTGLSAGLSAGLSMRLTVGLCTLLAGCLSPTPYLRPAVEVPNQWQVYGKAEGHAPEPAATDVSPSPVLQSDSRLSGHDGEDGQWWRAFGDAELTRLVDEVLAVNSKLAQAAMRIHQARLRAAGAATNAYPTGTPTVTAGVNRVAGGIVHDAGYSLSFGYDPDVWGKLAAERDAARWSALGTEAAHDGIRMTLVGDTAKHYWEIGYLNQELVRNESDLAHARRTLAIVKGQHAAGAAHGLDVLNAEQNVTAVEGLRLDLLAQRTRHRNDLAILLDRAPQAWAQEPRQLPDGPLPGVPAGLPAELLARRPDLREAEAALREYLSRFDEARAKLYPNFSLTASAGRSSSTLIGLLSNPIPGVGLAIVLPLLDWGKQRTEVSAAHDEYKIRTALFREKWYTALAEVDSALSARWKLVQEDALHARALDQAQRAEALARARFEVGVSDVRSWLDQQKKVREARGALAKNQLEQRNGLVALYKALGGGAQVNTVHQGEHPSLTR